MNAPIIILLLMITNWTDITTADVNDIVCDCSAESGLQITAREVLAVQQQVLLPEQADESWQDARMDSKREGIRGSKR